MQFGNLELTFRLPIRSSNRHNRSMFRGEGGALGPGPGGRPVFGFAGAGFGVSITVLGVGGAVFELSGLGSLLAHFFGPLYSL